MLQNNHCTPLHMLNHCMQSRHIDVKISYHTQCNRKVKILKGTLLNEMSMGADERRQTDCMRNIEKKKTNE